MESKKHPTHALKTVAGVFISLGIATGGMMTLWHSQYHPDAVWMYITGAITFITGSLAFALWLMYVSRFLRCTSCGKLVRTCSDCEESANKVFRCDECGIDWDSGFKSF